MATQSGLWIDHRKAVIVTMSNDDEQMKTIESDFAGHTRHSGAPRDPEDRRERRLEGELDKYYDEVIASVGNADAILIMGPGEAKSELKKRFERVHRDDRIVAIEAADKMTDRQVAARVREHFSGETA